MSYPGPPDPNPYASPVPPPVASPVAMPVTAGGPRQDSMDYMRAYNYVFENPNWLTNLLLLALCSLCLMIPVVGIVVQLVVLGYQFETVDLLLKSHGRQYPDFDFGRIGDYLVRGLWPFLVSLIATFVLLPVVYIGMGIVALAVAGIASASGDTLGPILGFGLGAVAVVLLVVVIALAAMLMIAMILRSGLAQDFVAAF